MTRVVGDLFRSWDIIAVGVLISLGVLLTAVIIARFNLLIGITTGIFGFIALILFVCLVYMVFIDGNRIDDRTCEDFGAVEMEDCDSDRDTFRIFSYVLIVLLSLIGIGMLFIFPVLERVRKILSLTM
mmetsp:Transcript_11022/g.1654  ORF Transcript_11022/g.1654 Transcript_11022/m.1654 type:complete len:128 (+) Transcript_11022:547-930(+)